MGGELAGSADAAEAAADNDNFGFALWCSIHIRYNHKRDNRASLPYLMIKLATAVKMGDKLLRLAFGAIMVVGVVLAVVMIALVVTNTGNIAVLNPKGELAIKERDLMAIATLLMLVVVIPVFVLTFTIAWRYRAGNSKAAYTPNWDHHRWAEFTWWAFPCAIILVLSVITWQSTHELDPYKPLASTAQPIKVQVVAMQWKWLFIYPDQQIATVNKVRLPQGVPVQFEITSDAPMNSFWIPQLAGQVYAMAGMSTQLHVRSDEVGMYQGSSANLSGEGFAGMRFAAEVMPRADYDAWVKQAQSGATALDRPTYDRLAEPSKNEPVAEYSAVATGLYDDIVMKYMHPEHASRPLTTGVAAQ